MPELPEVETTRRGLEPHLAGRTVAQVIIRNHNLRWPIPSDLPEKLQGQPLLGLQRRAKYLLLNWQNGTLIIHLGMSGSLRILPANTSPRKHDHFDLVMDNGMMMRLRDPRRFGAVLWHVGDITTHPLLTKLGPEPLAEGESGYHFDGHYLYRATRKRTVSIKQCIMDNHVVVGVGNIYSNEALFRARINPRLAAGRLSLGRCKRLTEEIRATLTEAIELGGSTLRDFVNTTGEAGYFQLNYWVYGRAGKPCRVCGKPLQQIKQGQRSSFYCSSCQR